MPFPYTGTGRFKHTSAYRRYRRAPPMRLRYRKRRYKKTPTRRFFNGTMHNFKKTMWLPNQSVALDANGEAFQAHAWAFSDLTNATSYSRLWDAYRIRKIKMEFIPVANTNPIGETSAVATVQQLPKLVIAADYDDETAPTSVEALLQRQGSKLKNFTHPCSKIISPAIAGLAFTSALSSGYTQKRGVNWIPTEPAASLNLKQYGIKNAFVGQPTTTVHYHLRTTFWFTMKQPKQA